MTTLQRPMSSTPLMQQYRDIKSRHQDAILFFRMGEFYEMFYDDAETASRALGLTLPEQLIDEAGDRHAALLCYEREAAGCHRSMLVERVLEREAFEIRNL